MPIRSLLLFASSFALPVLRADDPGTLIYHNWGALEDYEVVPECNPGGTTRLPCGPDDVGIQHQRDEFSIVTANTRRRKVFVNAIARKRFTDRTPDNKPLELGTYRYIYAVRLPQLPQKDGVHCGEAVHQMIQFWDGANRISNSRGRTIEGAIYWDINPHSDDFQHIKVYSGDPLKLIDTGIVVPADIQWHTFEIRVDLKKQIYTGMVIDDQWNPLTGIPLARVPQPTWGKDVSLILTAESENAFPGNPASLRQWATQFKDVKLFRE